MNISYSNLKDYIKSSEYFYKKYISKEIVEEPSEAMYKGKFFEYLLLNGKSKFLKKYKIVSRRSDKETELSQTTYEEISGMVKALKGKTIWKELNSFVSQEKITFNLKIGLFEAITGIPDFYKYNPDTKEIIIVDTKTSSSANPEKYRWQVRDMNYYLQMAFYRFLLQKKYPDALNFSFYHLVIGTEENVYPIYLYELQKEEVDSAEIIMKENIQEISKLKTKKDFADKDVKFEEAIQIF